MTSPKSKTSKTQQCEFCKASFAKEETLLSHMCDKKKRFMTKDDKIPRLAFTIFNRFHAYSFRTSKTKTLDSFIDSRLYNDFISFAKYVNDVDPINLNKFIEFLVTTQTPIKKWKSPNVYEIYVRELCKQESASAALERNFLLMQQWATETGEQWYDFFRLANTNLLVLWISIGRVSPWIIYTSASAMAMMDRFSDDQIDIVQRALDPVFWSKKLNSNQDDVDFIREQLDLVGL